MFQGFVDINTNELAHILNPDLPLVVIGVDPGKSPTATILAPDGRVTTKQLAQPKKVDIDVALLAIEEFIEGLFINPLDEDEPGEYEVVVGVEQIMFHQLNQFSALYLTHSMAQVITKAAMAGISYVACHTPTNLKKWATGDARADKNAMVDAALKLGLPGVGDIDHNIADSYLIAMRTKERIMGLVL